MTAQLSKGPPSPPEMHSRWKRKKDGVWFKVLDLSSSGNSVCLCEPHLTYTQVFCRVTTLRRDYEEIK